MQHVHDTFKILPVA